MPVATQVKRRRGTAEENNAFTGAEGEITVDLTNKTLRVHDGETLGGTAVETQRNKSTTITAESTDNQYPSAKAVVDYVSTNSGGAMPVGAIFTTPRTGTIGGAVEANGGEYNIADYSGEGSIGALLTAGNIAYVSKAEFQTQVTNTGACDSFGWNGDGDPTFLVPKLLDSSVRPDYSQSVQHANSAPSSYTATEDCIIEVKGATLSYDLYSGSTEIIVEFAYSANYTSAWVFLPKGLTMKLRGTKSQYNNFVITPVRSSNATRYMVQLATGATGQALETCTSVLSDVSAVKNASNFTATGKMNIIRFVIPDYAAGVTVTPPFTAPNAGLVAGYWYGNGNIAYINGSVVGATPASKSPGSLQIPVDSGDVLTLADDASNVNLYFYPFKGAQ